MSQRTARIVLSGFVLIVLGFVSLLYLLHLAGPDSERIKEEFAEQNPGTEVVFATVGEGDFDNAWYHIGYRKNGENEVRVRVILYQRDGMAWRTSANLQSP